MFSTECPAHIAKTLRPCDPFILAGWPCGWTHFLPVDAPVGHWRLALMAVEQCNPAAVDHIAHLRTMRDISASAAASRAEVALWRRFGATATTFVEDPTAMAMHGPVSEPIDNYAERADNYAALASRMRERVERMKRPPLNTSDWTVRPASAQRGMWLVSYGHGRTLTDTRGRIRYFGSAAAAVNFMGDPLSGCIDWPTTTASEV
jgi:hypothetical protein